MSLIREVGEEWINLIERKNSNYGDSVFKPPILIPNLDPESAILVRMSDKISRLSSLMAGEPDKVGESIEDTVKDLGAYCLLFLIARRKNG